MEAVPRTDPRLVLIAAVLAVGETAEGLALCERFVTEVRKFGPKHPPAGVTGAGISVALSGLLDTLASATDHAEFLSETIMAELPPSG